MALKQLGSSYMVANSTSGSGTSDTELWYRGWKDFLFWIDIPIPGVAPRITIRAANGDDENNFQMDVELFECDNLLDDPGTQQGETTEETIPARTKYDNPHEFSVSVPQTTGSKLYRLRIKPYANDLLLSVQFYNIQWYSMECWEPRYNFYAFGISSLDPTEQYFFIPKLPEGETVRVRLQVESRLESARIDIYTEDGNTSLADAVIMRDDKASGDNPHPYFAIAELSGDDLPSEGTGAVYRFKLTNPNQDNGSATTQQFNGNCWVRFSRNVPPYFANLAERLIYPVIHREFDPVVYCSESGSPPTRQTYRAYLTVPRGQAGVPSNAKVMVNVDETIAYGTAPSNVAAVSAAAPSTRESVSGEDLEAQLLDANNRMLADSTDKVDKVYFVPAPTYGSNWPTKMLVAYDNGNGRYTSAPTSPTDTRNGLKNGRFNVVQTNTEDTLDIITNNAMKAMGVLYGGSLPEWFNQYPTRPDDSRVLFWALLDEPDAGPGIDDEGEVTGVTTLKDIYDGMYNFKGKTSTKPCSLNLMHTIFLEEFSKGCDIVSHDPFVKKEYDDAPLVINKIKDAVDELVLVSGDDKKTLLVLWWWWPKSTKELIDSTLYSESFNAKKDNVDGVGGWNFSAGGVPPFNRLDTYSEESGEVWTEIRARNGEFNPPPSD